MNSRDYQTISLTPEHPSFSNFVGYSSNACQKPTNLHRTFIYLTRKSLIWVLKICYRWPSASEYSFGAIASPVWWKQHFLILLGNILADYSTILVAILTEYISKLVIFFFLFSLLIGSTNTALGLQNFANSKSVYWDGKMYKIYTVVDNRKDFLHEFEINSSIFHSSFLKFQCEFWKMSTFRLRSKRCFD